MQGKLLCFGVYSRNEGEWGQNFCSIIKIFIKKVLKIFPKTWQGLKILASWGGHTPIPLTCPRMVISIFIGFFIYQMLYISIYYLGDGGHTWNF